MMQRVVLLMLDGFGWDYWLRSDMPNLRRLAARGECRPGRAVMPTLTNVNNVSIACAAWPSAHGIVGNSYYDEASDSSRFVEDASFLLAPTLFTRARGRGVPSALLTCKAKTLGILGADAAVGLAVENLSGNAAGRYGTPPDMYSSDVNYWLWDAALDILDSRPEIGFIYVHTTDYPMHRWAPEEEGSLEHLRRIDAYLGRVAEAHPDVALLVTADHGMNPKKECVDLQKVCAGRGRPVRFVVSPVADRLVAHHGGHGGVAYVYLEEAGDSGKVCEILLSTPGVERVLSRAEAAAEFHLLAERLGDLVVLADKDTVFGFIESEREALSPGYRNHGSVHEIDVPIIVYNLSDPARRAVEPVHNFEIGQRLF